MSLLFYNVENSKNKEKPLNVVSKLLTGTVCASIANATCFTFHHHMIFLHVDFRTCETANLTCAFSGKGCVRLGLFRPTSVCSVLCVGLS